MFKKMNIILTQKKKKMNIILVFLIAYMNHEISFHCKTPNTTKSVAPPSHH